MNEIAMRIRECNRSRACMMGSILCMRVCAKQGGTQARGLHTILTAAGARSIRLAARTRAMDSDQALRQSLCRFVRAHQNGTLAERSRQLPHGCFKGVTLQHALDEARRRIRLMSSSTRRSPSAHRPGKHRRTSPPESKTIASYGSTAPPATPWARTHQTAVAHRSAIAARVRTSRGRRTPVPEQSHPRTSNGTNPRPTRAGIQTIAKDTPQREDDRAKKRIRGKQSKPGYPQTGTPAGSSTNINDVYGDHTPGVRNTPVAMGRTPHAQPEHNGIGRTHHVADPKKRSAAPSILAKGEIAQAVTCEDGHCTQATPSAYLRLRKALRDAEVAAQLMVSENSCNNDTCGTKTGNQCVVTTNDKEAAVLWQPTRKTAKRRRRAGAEKEREPQTSKRDEDARIDQKRRDERAPAPPPCIDSEPIWPSPHTQSASCSATEPARCAKNDAEHVEPTATSLLGQRTEAHAVAGLSEEPQLPDATQVGSSNSASLLQEALATHAFSSSLADALMNYFSSPDTNHSPDTNQAHAKGTEHDEVAAAIQRRAQQRWCCQVVTPKTCPRTHKPHGTSSGSSAGSHRCDKTSRPTSLRRILPGWAGQVDSTPSKRRGIPADLAHDGQ